MPTFLSKKHLVFLTFLFFYSTVFSYDFSDVEELQELFFKKDFSALEEKIRAYEKEYEKKKDYHSEARLLNVYRTFDLNQSSLNKIFEEWIRKKPKSHVAYLGRAVYLNRQAWEKRGNRYISNTSRKQLSGFSKLMLLAQKDLHAAVESGSKSFVPYYYLIDGAKSGSYEKKSAWKSFKKGLEIDGSSRHLFLQYAYSIDEKWGGVRQDWLNLNKAAKTKEAKQAIKAARASIDAETFMREGDYQKASALIDKSISIGGDPYFHYIKYYLSKKTERKQAAKTHLIKALTLSPQSRFYNSLASYMYHGEKNWDLCIKYASRAIYRGKKERNMYGTRGYCHEMNGSFKKAQTDYKAALKKSPNDRWAKQALARIQSKLTPASFKTHEASH